jgi:hypothetical protein
MSNQLNKMNKNMNEDVLESINQETLERYAMFFMLKHTADEYKNNETLNNVKNELINIILNKDDYLKIWTSMSYLLNENSFIKQISHLKYLIISLQNEKIEDFDEWVKSGKNGKKEFEKITDDVYRFIECYNEPFVNWCHLDIYSYRFRRPLLIYILNTSNYALMNEYIHTVDRYILASLTEEQKQKVSKYLTISNKINQILFKSKICKDVLQYHLNEMINPKIEDIYNYTYWKDVEDKYYDELDFYSDNE